MTRQPLVARRAEELLGCAVAATAPVAGGDVATATRLRLSDGRIALMKTHPRPPAGMFAAEARGLRWLGAASPDGGVAVPELLAAADDCVILRWIEPGKVTTDTAAAFGRALAITHLAGHATFGMDHNGYIGLLPLPNRPAPTWAEFFATRRVLPYLKLAYGRGAVTEEQAAKIDRLAHRLTDLVPEEPPARLHGDLWSGNVLWGSDATPYLIDPAAHGGHRETDLAMLALFGLPHLQRVLEAYVDESAARGRPLEPGWLDRQGLHQLHPLLVHACMFGGGYGARAAAVADAF